MTGIAGKRGITAIFAALLIHVVVFTVIWTGVSQPEPAAEPGIAGVMVLVAASAAGASADASPPVNNDTPVPPDQEPVPSPDAETTTRHDSPKMPEAREIPAVRAAESAVVETRPVIQAQTPPITPPVRRKNVPLPKRKPYVPEKKVTIPQQEPAPTIPANKPLNPAKSDERKLVASTPLSGERGEAKQSQVATTGGGRVSAYGDYLSVVRSWLQEHKRYPRPARLRMMRGEASVGFVLDRSGRVVSYALEKSSGHKILDREVMAMVHRASPMPPFPPDLPRNRMRFIVPVNFNLR